MAGEALDSLCSCLLVALAGEAHAASLDRNRAGELVWQSTAAGVNNALVVNYNEPSFCDIRESCDPTYAFTDPQDSVDVRAGGCSRPARSRWARRSCAR